MTQWLQTSFWGLRTRKQRHMFLDAAVLLHGQPLQDLRCAWTAMVQFDDDLADDPDTAACIVDGCLAELVSSSLVSVHKRQQESWSTWGDVKHLVKRCAVLEQSLMCWLPCSHAFDLPLHRCGGLHVMRCMLSRQTPLERGKVDEGQWSTLCWQGLCARQPAGNGSRDVCTWRGH